MPAFVYFYYKYHPHKTQMQNHVAGINVPLINSFVAQIDTKEDGLRRQEKLEKWYQWAEIYKRKLYKSIGKFIRNEDGVWLGFGEDDRDRLQGKIGVYTTLKEAMLRVTKELDELKRNEKALFLKELDELKRNEKALRL